MVSSTMASPVNGRRGNVARSSGGVTIVVTSLPDASHFVEVGFEPCREHEQDDADIGQVADNGEEVRPCMARAWLRRGKERPSEHIQHRRSEDQAGENLTEDRRLPDSVRLRAGTLGRGNDERQNQQQLQ